MTDQNRAAFEAFFLASRSNKGAKKRPTFERLPDETYADDHTQRHWWTWQQAINSQAAELARLRGLTPECPPRPDHNNDASYQHYALPRYGLRWNGPGEPVSVPMPDGYWTPFHLALAAAA